ncbi:lamin L3 [Oryzias melastigma]|uniref:lamin L3 n=1 Tax=Oryzias melastigma TaxID=30732 RepID=UPI000CF81615|nr:lamin L3 [Oryzias melastigma]XP_036067283.1 lamin L3 [Oryzias melastigma]
MNSSDLSSISCEREPAQRQRRESRSSRFSSGRPPAPAAPPGRSAMASATSTPAARSSSRGRRSARSPARMQEKEELRHLNDRLANYIQRVQDLESDKTVMLLQLREQEEATARETAAVRRLYDEELADVRRCLDALAAERARLQIEHGNLQEEFQKLQSRNQKKESDLANALTQWRKTEAMLSAKEAENAKLLSENGRLGGDAADLQLQLENVERLLAETKNQLSSEILRRVGMENQVQTLKEQLELQKNISKQEILEVRSRQETRLVEVESGRRREFESKLAETMQQLREDHTFQLHQYKEEMEKTFSTKLQNAQDAAEEKTVSMTTTKEELEVFRRRLESLSTQLQQNQREKLVLEDRFQELQRTLDQERDAWQQKSSQKEQELLSMRTQMDNQLENYQNLLDVKLSLDMEINAYRKMLEVEEQRLQLSPSPSSHAAVPRVQERRKLRGRKRKHEEAGRSSPAYKMSRRSVRTEAVTVTEVDGKYVRIKNNSDKEQPLGGWVVRRVHPDSGDVSFQFPPSFVLAGGRSLTIWSSGAAQEAEPGDAVLENHSSWGAVADLRVVLLNPNHEEVSACWLSVQTTDQDDPEDGGLDFDDVFIAGSDGQRFHRQDLSKEASCCVM